MTTLRTPVCDLLGIEVPIVCAPFGPLEEVELAAAVCAAGGMGSLGTAVRPLPELREQWRRLRELTDRPFAINHTSRPLNEEAFEATLDFAPAAVSFHLSVPADHIKRAHDRGVAWIQQVMTLRQAEEAVAAGADVIVAQGGEAGGHGGWVGTMVLVPQVVDVAGRVPVLAAGGIADGRGLAAALTLGAQGALVGTRFLASEEMRIAEEWKRMIVSAGAEDAVKVVNSGRVLPPYTLPVPPNEPRALRTALVEQLARDPESIDPAEAGPRIVAAVLEGRGHEYLPFCGQSAGLVREILPAEEIVRRMVEEAVEALSAAGRAVVA
ncbi:NAD(P)H-dependent flavin oxidoreductase [Thermoactinospora rubra]|uniref:NAD(P)H-dependent flavin oxidoreductase n=1 Tax=Thermoactinospora rubra TaxID=1088767 RepID=UPI0019821E05|nr:nitronate monooxygenase [Thermoactinospora rubra]